MDISRCATCCEYVCLVSEGNLVGTSVSGTWGRDHASYSLPNHYTSDDNAIWIDTTPIRTGFPWRVVAEPTTDITLTGGKKYGSYDYRIYGSWTDINNHVYMRYVEHRPGATGLSYIHLELVLVSAGVSEVLAQHVFNNQTCYDDTAAVSGMSSQWGFWNTELNDFNGPGPALLKLCWDGETLVGEAPYYGEPVITGALPLRVAAYKTAGGTLLSSILTGSYSGVGTGTLSTEIVKVVFENFEYSIYEADDSAGTPCGECPEHCCDSPVPEEMLIEVTGVTGTNCTVFNGTWTLTRTLDLSATNPSTCAGDGRCGWIYYNDDGSGNLTRITARISDSLSTFLSVIFNYQETTALPPTNTQMEASATRTLPCDQITTFTNLTIDSTSTPCGVGSATARYKMVP